MKGSKWQDAILEYDSPVHLEGTVIEDKIILVKKESPNRTCNECSEIIKKGQHARYVKTSYDGMLTHNYYCPICCIVEIEAHGEFNVNNKTEGVV